MADTSVTYVGDNAATNFNVPFPYIDKSYVKVYLDTVLRVTPLDYVWLDSSTIQFVSAPGTDTGIVFRRVTPGDARIVDFQDGAVLTEADLDMAIDQCFHLAQESKELYADLINAELIRIATSQGITSTDPDVILASLIASMLTDEASATLQARITDIDDNAESILELTTNFQSQINAIAGGIAASVYIQDEPPVPGVGGIPDPITDGARWYDSNDNNHPYIYDGPGTQWLDIEDPRIGVADSNISILTVNLESAISAILQEEFVRVTENTALATSMSRLGASAGDGSGFILDTNTVFIDPLGVESFATRLTQLSVADGDNSSSISVLSDVTIPGLEGDISNLGSLYGVELDVNGYVTGFVQNNDGSQGSFVVMADRFAIQEPGETSGAGFIPFLVTGGVVSMQNVEISGNLVVAGSITASEIAAATITGGNIANGAIDSNQIAAGAITTALIDTNAITATLIAAGVIGTTHIDANAITSALIASGAVTATQLASGSVGSGHIVADAIDASKIAALAIAEGHIQTDAVSADKIPALAIAGTHIEANAISTGHISANAVTANEIAANSITAAEIAANTITASQIVAGTITASEILAGTITAAQIAANTITASEILANTITAAQIFAGTITAAEIAALTITADQIAANTITASEIVAGTITAAEIAALSITAGEIAANTITAAQIAAGTITATEITVANLAAISAEFGSVTMTAAGHLKGGQTAFNTGTGFFLGYESSKYKFSIGNATSYMTWDGTELTVKGDLVVGEFVTDNTNEILTANTIRSNSSYVGGLVKYKTFTVAKDGDVKIYFDVKSDTNTDIHQYATFQILLNTTQKQLSNIPETSYTEHNLTITGCVAGDQIHLLLRGGTTTPAEPFPYTCYVQDVSIRATVEIAPGGSVDLD